MYVEICGYSPTVLKAIRYSANDVGVYVYTYNFFFVQNLHFSLTASSNTFISAETYNLEI